jgi:hypothetical protein
MGNRGGLKGIARDRWVDLRIGRETDNFHFI